MTVFYAATAAATTAAATATATAATPQKFLSGTQRAGAKTRESQVPTVLIY